MSKKRGFFSKAGRFLLQVLQAAARFIFKVLVWLAQGLARALGELFRFSGRTLSNAARHAQTASSTVSARKPQFVPLVSLKVFEGAVDEFEQWVYSSKSTVGILLGSRGSGKSGLGMRMLENWASQGRRVCAMGFEPSSLPAYIRLIDSVDNAPNGSAVLVDEGGILFGSRDAMSDANKLLSRLLFVARHKDLSVLFISQNSANLEINAIRQADYLLLKKPSLLQKDFERGKIKDIYGSVSDDFKSFPQEPGLVYVYSDKFRGFASNALPSFWTERTGKAFGQSSLVRPGPTGSKKK